MKIRFYNYVKRENSTGVPRGEGHEYEVTLKSDTSVVHPTIIIDFADQEDPELHIFNYAYIPEFKRYYFVGDIKALRGVIWEYSLKCDILGTYRDTIGVQYLYLLRCSREYDGDVVDTYYPVKSSYTYAVRQNYTPWFPSGIQVNIDDGSFILGVVSRPGTITASTFGSIKYIALTRSELIKLVNYLLDANNLVSEQVTVTGVTNEAMKAIIDPLQFIKSCQWCPVRYSDFDASEQTGLSIWSWTASGVRYKNMPSDPPYLQWDVDFNDIPRHPLAAQRGNYLNTEPYTKMNLMIPPFGVIDLDTTLTAKAYKLVARVTYDLITGQGILEVHYDNEGGPIACRIQSQIGVPIQLTQVYNDYISAAGGVAGGAMGMLGSLLTGNIGGIVANGIGAITSAANAMKPIQSSIGGNGGFSDLDGWAALYAVFYDIPPEDRAHVGRPLCAEVNMSTMATGTYCLAMEGDVPINGTAGEQAQLKAYLEGGFYYE